MSQPKPPVQHILIDIAVPAEASLKPEDLEQLARESVYIELYRQGVIGSEYAASHLGIDRSAFLDLLSAHGVSWLDETMDVSQEADNARS